MICVLYVGRKWMCDSCEWEKFLDFIEDEMFNDEYSFAEDTVHGIFDWVSENKHITERQKNALKNIEGC